MMPWRLAYLNQRGRIKDGDSVIFFNFREDSVRQLTSLLLTTRSNFPRKSWKIYFVTMTEYHSKLCHVPTILSAAFKSAEIANPLAKIISENGLNQLHIAETEKYAHITYF